MKQIYIQKQTSYKFIDNDYVVHSYLPFNDEILIYTSTSSSEALYEFNWNIIKCHGHYIHIYNPMKVNSLGCKFTNDELEAMIMNESPEFKSILNNKLKIPKNICKTNVNNAIETPRSYLLMYLFGINGKYKNLKTSKRIFDFLSTTPGMNIGVIKLSDFNQSKDNNNENFEIKKLLEKILYDDDFYYNVKNIIENRDLLRNINNFSKID
jgi:hypothetical protein